MVSTLLLLKNGDITNVNVPSNTNVDNFTNKSYFQTKGNGSLKQLHYWQLFDDTIIIYGWENGEAGDENKHELPPPIDSSLYFGDLIIFRLDDNGKLSSFSKESYDIFIEHHMEGFSDLGEFDSDIPNEMDDMSDEDNEHQPDDQDYLPSASETDSDEDDEEDEDSSVSGNECEDNGELQEEELIDRDILVWGKRKVATTDSDNDDDEDNSD
jgi:hypothetical protein